MRSDDNVEKRRRCVDCDTWSPPVQTSYTLISRDHGWRLSKRVVDGRRVMEWRCPDCWTSYRAQGGKLV